MTTPASASTLTIGLVGSPDNGKSTLFQALVEVMDLDGALVPPATIRHGNRNILLIEKPAIGHGPPPDGLILVLDAALGLDDEYLALLHLALTEGIRHMVVFVNKTDLVPNPQAQAALHKAVLDSLQALGLEAAVVLGSALAALEGDALWIEPIRHTVRALVGQELQPQ